MPSQQVIDSKDGAVYTASNGVPVAQPYAAQKLGISGPLLLQDFHQIDVLAHFARERIPERVVHANAAGAHGYFETTHDISDLTCAKIFGKVGNRARVTMRISTVGGESGSADTARDPRGFSVKIRTEEGNLDVVGNSTPVFFMRDSTKFPSFIHTQKRDPQTHLKDADMFWDYLSQNPESIHQVLILFSDRGTPQCFHTVHGYSGHTYKWVNAKGDWVYCKIHIRADGGYQTLDNDTASRLAGENPDYGKQKLFEAIEKKEYPSWTVYTQVMTAQQAESFRYNVLDLTKVWPHKEYPLRPFGKIVLNENVQNYFAEIEQAAFSPGHLIPGWEPSADPVLQSRLFSYSDAHRYRLGANYQQLPVNAPVVPVANFQRDGAMTFTNQGARPNYQSSISPLTYPGKVYDAMEDKHELWVGHARVALSEINELDFEQPRVLYQKVMNDTDREHLVYNVASHMKNIRSPVIRDRQLSVWAAVDQSLSDRIAKAIGAGSVQPLKAKPASEAWRLHVNGLEAVKEGLKGN